MNTEVFGERLKELRDSRHLTQEQLGNAIGVTRQYISNIEKKHKTPGKEIIASLADYFNVDMAYLMGNSDVQNSYNFDGIFKAGYEEALRTLGRLKEVPVYTGLSCGRGVGVDETPIDYVGVPTYMINGSQYFANPAEGDSMIPKIKSGDLLIFEESPVVESGKIGAFSLNGQYYCKRFKKLSDGSCWLFSDNESYEPIPINPTDDFRILGLYKLKLSKEQ